MNDEWEANAKKAKEKAEKEELIVEKSQLNDLPQEVIEKLESVKDDDDKKKLNIMSSTTVLGFTKNPKIQQKLFEMREVGKANLPILGKIIAKREEEANLNGYKTYTASKLAPLMSKDPKNVERFLDRVISKLQP